MPLPLSLSTRGIRSDTQVMAYVAHKYKATINILDVYALYCAFLGIFEAKVQELNYSNV